MTGTADVLTWLLCLALASISCDNTGAGRGNFAVPTAPTVTTPPPPVPSPPVPPPPVPPANPSGPIYEPGTGLPIQPGQTVSATISASDPTCYPNWDLAGRCRLFELRAPADGRLEVLAKRTQSTNFDLLDMFIVTAAGDLLIAFTGTDEEQASLTVEQGITYGIFVMTYPPFPLQFELTATLH